MCIAIFKILRHFPLPLETSECTECCYYNIGQFIKKSSQSLDYLHSLFCYPSFWIVYESAGKKFFRFLFTDFRLAIDLYYTINLHSVVGFHSSGQTRHTSLTKITFVDS